MRALIQRVLQAKVLVENQITGQIKNGYLILLGVGQNDTEAQAERLWNKILKLRIMSDSQGKTNLSLEDVQGEILVVSQFTLYADCRKGNRPSFSNAADPAEAKRLYEYFCSLVEHDIGHVETGIFAAEMQVELTNDGPFSIWIDTNDLDMPRHQKPNL
ncbi:MAG: D-tyrosyl-tRNA(Tyr) deacylase [Coriobacteriales bacterium]|nr:D-tyrosyl-tRNA(Tyr) deacylase [Coriobacteriales bacterium]